MSKHSCKILIAYHKPSELVQSDIYIPIHVGRDLIFSKSKDGTLSQEQIKWLKDNLIGDNTGDNISTLNRYFNEMSAVYWAWKNKGVLDNPEYIGLMHYRRHFIFSEKNTSKYTWLKNSTVYSYEYIDDYYLKQLDEKYIDSLLDKYDILASHKYNANNLDDGNYYQNCKSRFAQVADISPRWYEKMEELVCEKFPEYMPELKELDNEPNHYLCNMFVMKTELFDKYCEFSFSILMPLYEELKNKKTNIWQTRAIGFLAEFLTSMFISNYAKKTPQKVKELDLTYIENPEIRNTVDNIKQFIYSKKKYSTYKRYTILGTKIYVDRDTTKKSKRIKRIRNLKFKKQLKRVLKKLNIKQRENGYE